MTTGRGSRTNSERDKKLRLGIVTGAVARALSLSSPLLVIPLALEVLGRENYGAWVTVTALTSMLLWADLGLGNGLMTRLTKALAENDLATARALIGTAYAVLGVAALVAIGALALLAPLIPWESAIGSDSTSTARIAVITLAAFLVNVPLGLIQRVQYALQEVALSNQLMALGPVLTVTGAAISSRLDLSASMTVLLLVIGPPLASVVATVVTGLRHRELVPARGLSVAPGQVRSLLTIGLAFLVVQMLSAVALNADNLIIANVLDPVAVVDYSIAARVFVIAGVLISAVSLPLWPANADALARGEVEWVRRATKRIVLLSGTTMVIVSLVLVVWGPHAIAVWLDGDIEVSRRLLASFASFWFLVAITSPAFMVMNAVGRLARQIAAWGAFCALSIPLKVAFASRNLEMLPIISAGLYACLLVPVAWSGYRKTLLASRTQSGS